MLLAMAAGNTNIVFAIYGGEKLRGSWRSSTDVRRTADEYAVWFTHLMNLSGLSPSDVDSAIISSVVPDVLFNLKTLATRYFGAVPRVVGEPGLDLGIKVLLARPDEI